MTRPEPSRYPIPYAARSPTIDGLLDETEWSSAPWSAAFRDIEGDRRPAPGLATRVRILWDSTYLFVGAALEEPHLWATLMQRDTVIYLDDDFEVFLDPDGDTHGYFELEINALGTVWDLFLVRPYRDGGPAVDGWDIGGLRSAVAVEGTLNQPGDVDRGWSVELAIPWEALTPEARGGMPPAPGDQWRINFSRVDWDLVIGPAGYAKRTDPATGRPVPERNWVWSPQGAVNMHLPEMWGIAQFQGRGAAVPVVNDPADLDLEWLLRRIYYLQRDRRAADRPLAGSLRELPPELARLAAEMRVVVGAADSSWEAFAPASDSGWTWRITTDGRIWRDRTREPGS